MMPGRFKDRAHAGAFLATKLMRYAHRQDVIVLGLPRGGVPVASVIAHILGAPLDVVLVRKLGVPGQRELAFGAIATGGVRFINKDIAPAIDVSRQELEYIVAQEQQELIRREKLYRGNRPPLTVQGQVAIVVDDGLATGASMQAAVMALRKMEPARIVVAVPVASEETCDALSPAVDEIVCGMMPDPLIAVGVWYKNFPQTTDQEVCALLNHAAKPVVHPESI
jgi:putative phosphoribosyl transferase